MMQMAQEIFIHRINIIMMHYGYDIRTQSWNNSNGGGSLMSILYNLVKGLFNYGVRPRSYL